MMSEELQFGPYTIPLNLVVSFFYLEEFSTPYFDEPVVFNQEAYTNKIRMFINAMNELHPILVNMPEDIEDEDMMAEIYEVGKKYFGEDKKQLRDFFRYFYYGACRADSGGRLSVIFKSIGYEDVYYTMWSNFHIWI